MSLSGWEASILERPGAAGRVREIEKELRLAAGLPQPTGPGDDLPKAPSIDA